MLLKENLYYISGSGLYCGPDVGLPLMTRLTMVRLTSVQAGAAGKRSDDLLFRLQICIFPALMCLLGSLQAHALWGGKE